VEPLTQALKDEYYFVRSGGAWALGEIGDVEAVEQLIQALMDEEWKVRWDAVRALGSIGGEKAVETLTQALKDKDRRVQEAAEDALETIKVSVLEKKRDVKGLIKALSHSDYYLARASAAKSLGKIGDRRAIKPLVKACKDTKLYVRKLTAFALAKFGDERAIEPLGEILEGGPDWFEKNRIIKALGEIGGARIVTALCKAFGESNSLVRLEAIHLIDEIFGNVGGREAFDFIIKDPKAFKSFVGVLSWDDNFNVRKAAVRALEKIGEPALEPLIKTIKNRDTYEHARKAAKQALEKILKKIKLLPSNSS